MKYRIHLPMYWFDETAEGTRALADRVIARLSGVDVVMSEVPVPYDSPELILGQTCWGPIESGVLPPLRVLGQPDYSAVPGGDGPMYRSAIIVRGYGDVAVPEAGPLIPGLTGRFAFNEQVSRSGLLALEEDARTTGQYLRREGALHTGSHRASVAAVASGDADFAAIDCQTLDLLRGFDPHAAQVRVIGWTAPRLGLPWVCHPSIPENLADQVALALSGLPNQL